MFRNALVHGVDFTISQNVCIRIDEIYRTLQDAYDIGEKNGRNSKEWKGAIECLNNLTK